MPDTTCNVLFLCTGNSARSIIAERLVEGLGRGRFRGFSAGSHPTGRVNPMALWVLDRHGYETAGLRSKNWAEFATPSSPAMDFVFTVCDDAAGEACPVWPGGPLTAHWGIPDPAGITGDEDVRRRAFEAAFGQLSERILQLVHLELGSLSPNQLRERLVRIGQMRAGPIES